MHSGFHIISPNQLQHIHRNHATSFGAGAPMSTKERLVQRQHFTVVLKVPPKIREKIELWDSFFNLELPRQVTTWMTKVIKQGHHRLHNGGPEGHKNNFNLRK